MAQRNGGFHKKNGYHQKPQKTAEEKKRDMVVSYADMYGRKFIDSYYQTLDFSRDNLHNFYRNKQSTIIWNGQKVEYNLLQSFFTKIPQSRHTMKSLNIQPIILNKLSNYPTILISVNGTVSYLGSNSIPFTHIFTITPQIINNNNNNNNEKKYVYYIVSDAFRSHQDIGN